MRYQQKDNEPQQVICFRYLAIFPLDKIKNSTHIFHRSEEGSIDSLQQGWKRSYYIVCKSPVIDGLSLYSIKIKIEALVLLNRWISILSIIYSQYV